MPCLLSTNRHPERKEAQICLIYLRREREREREMGESPCDEKLGPGARFSGCDRRRV